jgi:hypothetical protein
MKSKVIAEYILTGSAAEVEGLDELTALALEQPRDRVIPFLNLHANGLAEKVQREVDLASVYFKPISWDELERSPAKQWIVDQVLGEGDLAMIYGPSGSGKTFTAFNLIGMLVRGNGKFAGRFQVNRPCNVVYMTQEGRSGLGQRALATSRSMNLTQEEKDRAQYYFKVVQFVNPDAPNYYLKYLSDLEILGFKPDVIIIDHLSSTVPGKGDSDQAAATSVHACVAHIQETLGCAVVIMHHTGYDTSHSRGMTNYKDVLDMQIKIENTNNPRKMSCDKNKDGEAWDPIEFDIIPVDHTESCTIEWGGTVKSRDGSVADQLDKITDYIAQNPGLTQNALVEKLTTLYDYGETATRNRIRDLARKGIVTVKEGGNNSHLHYVK